MGRDPTTSVADTDGRLHDTENVFLAGTGTIPNRLAVNPTLTAAALAVHTADTVAEIAD
jgi:choline dehydrogenase-like flavoprotein